MDSDLLGGVLCIVVGAVLLYKAFPPDRKDGAYACFKGLERMRPPKIDLLNPHSNITRGMPIWTSRYFKVALGVSLVLLGISAIAHCFPMVTHRVGRDENCEAFRKLISGPCPIP